MAPVHLEPSSRAAAVADSVASGDSDVQKKISMLSNPRSLSNELFPHWQDLSVLLTAAQGAGEGEEEGGGAGEQCRRRSGLIVVASLVSKVPNLGGRCGYRS